MNEKGKKWLVYKKKKFRFFFFVFFFVVQVQENIDFVQSIHCRGTFVYRL